MQQEEWGTDVAFPAATIPDGRSFVLENAAGRSILPLMESLYAKIQGSVQGVGFRYFTLQHAKMLDLVGYVKNMPNGDVDVFAQGERDNLETLLARLKHGPNSAYVRETRVTWKNIAQKYDSFEVAY